MCLSAAGVSDGRSNSPGTHACYEVNWLARQAAAGETETCGAPFHRPHSCTSTLKLRTFTPVPAAGGLCSRAAVHAQTHPAEHRPCCAAAAAAPPLAPPLRTPCLGNPTAVFRLDRSQALFAALQRGAAPRGGTEAADRRPRSPSWRRFAPVVSMASCSRHKELTCACRGCSAAAAAAADGNPAAPPPLLHASRFPPCPCL